MNAAVTSPPYADTDRNGKRDIESRIAKLDSLGMDGKKWFGKKRCSDLRIAGYSGAVTSPPYGDQTVVQGAGVTHRILKIAREQGMAEAVKAYRRDVMDTQKAHGRWSDANIQRHVEMALATAATGGYGAAVTSPPYTDSISSNKGTFDPEKFVKPGGPHSQANIPSRYSKSHGQIGNLRDPRNDIDGVLTSPPYGDTDTNEFAIANQGLRFDQLTPEQLEERNKAFSSGRHGYRSKASLAKRTEGQIGCLPDRGEQGETYLAAMLAVYRELHAVLKPGGIVCLVTKNPVKAGAIRRLDADTIRLMEAAGFTLIERKMAMLTEDLGEQGRLDGGADKIRRERKSFFKRLFERKRPDLAVDHEDVMFFQRI